MTQRWFMTANDSFCLLFAERFPDREIVNTLCAKLS